MCIFFEGPILNRLYLRTPPVYGQSYFAIAQTIAPYTFPRSYSRKMLDIFQFARNICKKTGYTFCIQSPIPHFQASLSEILNIVCR